jgi:hypothetical protein
LTFELREETKFIAGKKEKKGFIMNYKEKKDDMTLRTDDEKKVVSEVSF